MSKILLFSDLHCHMHKGQFSRLEDCLKVLTWIFKTTIDRGIDTIIFAGDLFQDRYKIHIISYQRAFEIIHHFMSNHPQLKLFLLIGNHDMWYSEKWDVSSIAPLKAIRGVTVVDEACTKEVIPNFAVDFLPYTKNPVADIEKSFRKKSPLLISHVAVDGADLNGVYHKKAEVSVEYDGDMVKVDKSVFTGWRKVFLGHYHSSQKLDNVEYIGSPLQLNFGEAFQKKHIIIFDTNKFTSEYVINDFSPEHLIINEKDIKKHKLEGNFVRIIVSDITSTDIIDMKNEISKKAHVATLEFEEGKKKKEETLKVKFDFSSGEILEKYIDACETKLDRNRLLKVAKEICEEVRTRG